MKAILFAAAVALTASQSVAATIKSATLDASKKNIIVEVVHGGGCGQHDYSLKIGLCKETYPVRCDAELIHKSNDFCEALIHRTVVFNLAEHGLNDSYFKGGSLTITGDHDWQTKKASTATVRLP